MDVAVAGGPSRPEAARGAMRSAMGRSPADAVRRAVGRVVALPGATASGVRGFWSALTPATRRRLGAASGGAVLAVLLLALLTPALPCGLPGSDRCGPADDADDIVPADTLAYVHLSLDPSSDQYERAAATAGELPALSRLLVVRLTAELPGPGGQAADVDEDIATWSGSQIGVAILPRGEAAAEQVQLVEEDDREGAEDFADSIAPGAPQVGEHEGVEVSAHGRGLATASVSGFLAIGTERGVREVIDVAEGAGNAESLADDSLAGESRDELPAERFATAYLSADGIERLIASPGSPLSSLEPFVDATSSRGAAASLGAGEDSLELAVRSILDSERAEKRPGFFAAFPAFDRELPPSLAGSSLAYVGMADPGTTVTRLLDQAAAEAPDLAKDLNDAARRLEELGKVDVQRQLLPALDGEAAFALQPRLRSGEDDTGETGDVPPGLPGSPPTLTPSQPAVPILEFLAADVDARVARNSLARLQGPLSEALDTGAALRAPAFERRLLDGVAMEVLSLTPALNLSYALDGDRLAVATQPEGVEQLVAGEGGLAEAERFQRALDGFPEPASLVAYLDLGGLIELGEREGLAEDPAYAALAPELRRLDAFGLAVSARASSLDTDLRVALR